MDYKKVTHSSIMQTNGCSHYRRNCELLAPCCNTFYTCRKCHDETIGEDHVMDRYKVTTMRCLYCKTVQPVSNECVQCEKEMANYYCDICHFYDDDDKEKYLWHCEECGYCRNIMVGVEKYTHCSECNVCMPVGHTIHINMDTNCPICMEKMNRGYDRCLLPGPCQHTLHEKCYLEYRSHGKYSCPVCSKTFATLDMTSYWAIYDREIISQPMPETYKDIPVIFLCNDCNIKESTTLNLIGYKCRQCVGYNTVAV